VSYIGGVDADNNPQDTRTLSQKRAMYYIVCLLREKYPSAVIQGHRDFPGVHKACPSFNVKDWLKESIPYLSEYKRDCIIDAISFIF
jgi:N-acetylmuramoyl-L-alanine amidase